MQTTIFTTEFYAAFNCTGVPSRIAGKQSNIHIAL